MMNIADLEQRILDLANCWPEVTTSDLQGMAHAIAREIHEAYTGHARIPKARES